jgi:hypothetical protein
MMSRSEKNIVTRLKYAALDCKCSINQLAKMSNNELRIKTRLGWKSMEYLRALDGPKPLEFWL